MKSNKKFKKVLEKKETKKFILYCLLTLVGFMLGLNLNLLGKLNFFKSAHKVSSEEVISARELKEVLSDKDFTLINVHTPYEGEIEKTDSFIEYDSMKASEARLPKDKNAPIVLYCKSGRMSAQALQTLKSMGYTNLRHLKGGIDAWGEEGFEILDLAKLPNEVIPEEGYELPISWGDIGPILLDIGVIDLSKFEKVMNLTEKQKEILTRGSDSQIKITAEDSRFVVNLLWALGLAQKSKVYEEGPMGTEYKNQAGNFASTGGWTLAKGKAVDYLNRYFIVELSDGQQEKVVEITKNVYRPCCGNSTWFPDCNHGMAALAAIELMVSAGLPDEEIYNNLLKLNSFWFPQNYLTAATYFARQGVSWNDVDAKLVLGQEYSSAQGAMKLTEKVGPLPYGEQAGGSCGPS